MFDIIKQDCPWYKRETNKCSVETSGVSGGFLNKDCRIKKCGPLFWFLRTNDEYFELRSELNGEGHFRCAKCHKDFFGAGNIGAISTDEKTFCRECAPTEAEERGQDIVHTHKHDPDQMEDA